MTSGTDVLQPIAYSRDHRNIERLPQALLLCFIGLAFLVYGDPPRPGRLWIAMLVLAAVVVLVVALSLVLGYVLDRLPAAVGLGLVVALVAITLLVFGVPSRSIGRGSRGAGVLGWLFLTVGAGWLAAVIARHFVPGPPALRLAREGVAMLVGRKEVVIPWQEIREVESRFELDSPSHVWDVTTLLVSREFYDRVIFPQRTFLRHRGWDTVFRPKGALMQIALHHRSYHVAPNDIREPVEARWHAFRESARASVPTTAAADAPLVYGRWSGRLSGWRALKFAIPLLGILGVVTNAAGLWDTAALKALREQRAATLKRYEEQAQEQRRFQEEMRRSNEAAEERERRSREMEREMNRRFAR